MALVAVGAVLVVALVVGGLVAGVVWLVVQANKRQTIAWRSVAEQHGLQNDGRTIAGVLRGQPVHAGLVTRGSGDSRTTYTVVSSTLRTPLDLGLSLRHHGFFNDMFHKSQDIAMGDSQFDAAFIVSADEESRVRALLDDRLRRLLRQHLAGDVSFRLGDTGLSVERVGVATDSRWLSWALDLCALVNAQLDAGRRRTPPSSWLRHHRQAWLGFAQAHGLQGYDTPLSMWGTIEGIEVHAYAVRVDRGHYQLEIGLRFGEALGLGLMLQPKGLLDKVAIFFGSQDHRLGDHRFDDTYRLRVLRTDVVGEVLDEAIRGELLDVHHSVGPIQLDDEALTVRLPTFPSHPNVVPQTVHRLLGITERLGARGVARIGPYR
jgi:hypothetical protein